MEDGARGQSLSCCTPHSGPPTHTLEAWALCGEGPIVRPGLVLPLLRTERGFRPLGSKLLGAMENLGGMVRQVMGSRAGM